MIELSAKEIYYPKITIVTPSYNQAKYLKSTILSVLNQNYPNLEYIIMDGGSDDGCVDLIKSFQDQLFYWTSQKDEGQADAIHRGFQIGTGQILAWLNSDDTYMPNALFEVAKVFQQHPEVQVVYGNANLIDENDIVIRELHDVPFSKWGFIFGGINIHQASVFWRRDIYFQVGGLNSRLNYAMDYDLFMKFVDSNANFYFINKTLANFRIHRESKTYVFPSKHSSEAITSKQKFVHEPSIIFFIGHFIYQVRRIFWLIWQRDFHYFLNGLRNRFL